ncbi:MAG: PP2C family protein-serine/threonine phosphatase [Phycisphaerales bacterium]
MTIRQRLLVWMVGSITLVYVAVLGYGFIESKDRALQQTDERYREALEWRASALSDELDAAATTASDVAETVALAATPSRAADTLAERMFARLPIVTSVELVYSGAGTEGLKRYERGVDGALAEPRFLPAAVGLEPGAWASVKPDGADRRAIWMTPIISQDAVTAQALIEIPAEAFEARLGEPIVDRSLLLLLDDAGRYLWHYNREVLASDVDVFSFARDMDRPSIAEAARTALSGEAGKTRMPVGFVTPEPYMIYYHPVGETGWTLVTAVPEAELLAPVYTQVTRSATIMVLGLLLIVGAVWFTARRITAPIERISEAAKRLGEGKDYEHVATHAPLELRVLDDVLEGTSSQLTHLTASRLEEVARREFAEGELRVARSVQESLLPEPIPEDELRPFGLDIAGQNVPASGVAGDFFDYLVDAKGRLIVCIADVSGKGARAAMLMAVARTAFRTAADTCEHPGDLVVAINDLLLETTHDIDGSFITMKILAIEPSGRITFANAGHPHAAQITADGRVSAAAPPTGTIVGAFKDVHLQARTEHLELDPSWRSLVLVTDGVLEAAKASPGTGDEREIFETDRLHETLRSAAPLSAHQITDRVVRAVRDFEGDYQTDDISVVAIVRHAVGA